MEPKDPRIVDAPEAPENLRTQEFKAARAVPVPGGAYESEAPPRPAHPRFDEASTEIIGHQRRELDHLRKDLAEAQHKLRVVELLAEACPNGVPPELLRVVLQFMDGTTRAT